MRGSVHWHFAGHVAVQYAKYDLGVTEPLAMSTEHHLEAIPAHLDSTTQVLWFAANLMDRSVRALTYHVPTATC